MSQQSPKCFKLTTTDHPGGCQPFDLTASIDRQLRFTAHIRSTALRPNSLRKCAPLLSSHGQATVYKAFVRPILEYCPSCGWVHLRPLWVSWTLCNAVHSISLATSTACRAFHIVVMWQLCPTFSNLFVYG